MHICMHCMDIPLQRTTTICTAGISAESIYSAQTLVSPRETAKRCYKMHPLLRIIADNCRCALCQHTCTRGLSTLRKQVTASRTSLSVLPPSLNHSRLESQSCLVSVSQTVFAFTPSPDRLRAFTPPSSALPRPLSPMPLTINSSSSQLRKEMQSLGKQHWVGSCIQQK